MQITWRNANRFVLAFMLYGAFIFDAKAQNPMVPESIAVEAMWGVRTTKPYAILPRPETHSNKGTPYVHIPAKANLTTKPVDPYAYGWFGTKPTPHWYRQFGTRNAYSQWTLK